MDPLLAAALDPDQWPDPGVLSPGRRGALADDAWERVVRAEADGDAAAAERYLDLLQRYDDGRYEDLIEGTATLEVESDPAGAEVWVVPLGRGAGCGDPVRLGRTPLDPVDLAPGRYRVRLGRRGYAETYLLLDLRRGSDVRLGARLFAPAFLDAHQTVIAAPRPGQALFHNLALDRAPVTRGAYQRFLDRLSEEDPGQAIALALPPDDGDPDAPVCVPTLRAARAFCRWHTGRTGNEHALPTREDLRLACDLGLCAPAPASAPEEWTEDSPHTALRPRPLRMVCPLGPGGGRRVTLPTVPSHPGPNRPAQVLPFPAGAAGQRSLT